MWTIKTRPRYNRDRLRYPSDLTDAEWSMDQPLMPPAKRGERRREVDVRQVVNGVMYVLSTGCQWRYIPKDLPPRSTLNDYLTGGATMGRSKRSTTRSMSMPRCSRTGGQPDSLRDRQPEREKRGKRGVCIDPPGYDAGKKIKGIKRHILVDTVGCCCTPRYIPRTSRTATAAFCCSRPCSDLSVPGEAVRRCRLAGTTVRHRRGKGSAAPIGRDSEAFGPRQRLVGCRCAGLSSVPGLAQSLPPLAKDLENLSRNALAFLQLASIRLMLRKLCNPV